MRLKPWVKMPALWLKNGTVRRCFPWRSGGSAAIAALQMWIVLVTQAEQSDRRDEDRGEGEVSPPCLEVSLTYEELMFAAGLSRKLIAAGLNELQKADLVKIVKEGRNNRYIIPGIENGQWCKLPARALYSPTKQGRRIPAFQHFQKRTKCELNALKLFLYYAAARDNSSRFTMTAFEKLHEYTGVAEKDIPKANAFLLTVGLLASVDKEASAGSKFKEANKYLLTGHGDLFVGQTSPPA